MLTLNWSHSAQEHNHSDCVFLHLNNPLPAATIYRSDQCRCSITFSTYNWYDPDGMTSDVRKNEFVYYTCFHYGYTLDWDDSREQVATVCYCNHLSHLKTGLRPAFTVAAWKYFGTAPVYSGFFDFSLSLTPRSCMYTSTRFLHILTTCVGMKSQDFYAHAKFVYDM